MRTWACSTSWRACERQAGAPHYVIEAALQHDDQVFAGRALHPLGFFKIVAKLPFQQPVGALYLLLFAQLQAVAGNFRAARLPVLTRNKVALFNGALLGKAPQTLQEQLLRLTAAKATNCFTMSCQLLFSLPNSL